MGHPAYEITEGEILFDGEDLVRARRRRARAARPLPRVPVPARGPGRDGDELPAQRDQRDPQGARGGRTTRSRFPQFRKDLLRGDGPPEGLARARVALPQRRVLGRREEARRDPADGDAEAEDRGARRDRLGPRHRRAADRRRRRQGARRPGDGRARDHALPADPQLRHARFRARVHRRAYRGRRRPGARAHARGRGLREIREGCSLHDADRDRRRQGNPRGVPVRLLQPRRGEGLLLQVGPRHQPRDRRGDLRAQERAGLDAEVPPQARSTTSSRARCRSGAAT